MADDGLRPLSQPGSIDFRWSRSANADKKDLYGRKLLKSLQTWGAALVTNPPASSAQVCNLEKQRSMLFNLPDTVKHRYAAENPVDSGYTPFSAARFCAPSSEAGEHDELRESWAFHCITHPPGTRQGDAESENAWPIEAHGFREAYEPFAAQTHLLASQILETLALRLKQPMDFFTAMTNDGLSLLRVMHYPPIETQTSRLRVEAHKDFTFLTVIACVRGVGLELLAPDKASWRPVTAGPEDVIVLAGETMEHVTYGAVPAAVHRVSGECGTDESRYSTACFVAGNNKTPLKRIALARPNKNPAANAAHDAISPLEFMEECFKTHQRDAMERYEKLPVIYG